MRRRIIEKRTLIFFLLLILMCSLFLGACTSEEGEKHKGETTGTTATAVEETSGDKETTSGGAASGDKYLTEPVPEGKPEPTEPQDVKVDKKTVYHCTISIECATILDNMDQLTEGKEELVPEDGIILPATKVEFYQGESAFDVLSRETKNNKIHMEFVNTPIYNSAYIEGINNLYEFDCGSLSGWMYKVNDWYPNYGCSRYILADGDVIQWVYSCDLGRDIGGGNYQ